MNLRAKGSLVINRFIVSDPSLVQFVPNSRQPRRHGHLIPVKIFVSSVTVCGSVVRGLPLLLAASCVRCQI